ncbi:Probable 2-oxoglutarate dehydrogenase E1 component DHKTD1, mitochondrial [Papilio machaon]|uniref:Probable 2-oxoglutarate dehydrogenase E1 component DHKTD1, mitochondrial n=1 Tax=Papilio machaon TaxID=76193 RepID=A0A0N0PFQ2_PAPMA|nr:Probable 2-oxoglutarate dehydrogenase E1 component DHKTD1, mitochondrial [Papilio machaon]
MGKTRSKQLKLKEGDYSEDGSSRMGDKVLNVQIHGDAAFTGQGINQETLMLSQAPHFDVGGSLHVVVNNQVSRSILYSSSNITVALSIHNYCDSTYRAHSESTDILFKKMFTQKTAKGNLTKNRITTKMYF